MDPKPYLLAAARLNASDVHLKAGGPAYIRVDGDLKPLSELPVLGDADTEMMAFRLMDDTTARQFLQTNEADFSFTLDDANLDRPLRFRLNVFRQRDRVGLVARLVPATPPTFSDLGMPDAVRQLAEHHRGLVLVTGPTGAGKSSTTAAMIDHINRNRRCHVVTIEDPLEILHHDRAAIIDQREVGTDTNNFSAALKYVARQDPDVIFIGEMRDLETVTAAMQAAETGHLVISTLHTTDATETINRIVDMFPPHQQAQARITLASALQGIVSQRLVPEATGHGRVAAVEVMVATQRIYDFMLDPSLTDQVKTAIEEGDYYGMQTFDQHLLELYAEGRIAYSDALTASSNPHDFKVSLRTAGIPTR